MDLFSREKLVNLLPYDGIVYYYGKIFNEVESYHHLEWLLNSIDWKHDEAIIFGKHITTKRKVAWYGDDNFSYTYSNATKQALSWTDALLALKKTVEEITGSVYNSCLLNLYHDGNEGVSWHSDDEKALKENGAIASLTFGAERKFLFRHKVTRQMFTMVLENGSLMVMKGTTQKKWLHSIPKTKMRLRPRVNLTFRTMEIKL